MKRIALFSMVALACGMTTVARHTVATAQYDPHKRDELWARALGEFQSRGVLVAASDREGGVLTSQQQPTEVPCVGGSCKAIVAQQLTLTTGGLATLRTNRNVTTGNGLDVAPAVEARYQQETNELLTAIAGSPAVTFLPPAPARPPPPPTPARTNEDRRSAPCETYQDCPPGSICSDGACRP